MKKKDIERFFARFAARTPEPTGELEYANDFTLLVAVLLVARRAVAVLHRLMNDPPLAELLVAIRAGARLIRKDRHLRGDGAA